MEKLSEISVSLCIMSVRWSAATLCSSSERVRERGAQSLQHWLNLYPSSGSFVLAIFWKGERSFGAGSNFICWGGPDHFPALVNIQKPFSWWCRGEISELHMLQRESFSFSQRDSKTVIPCIHGHLYSEALNFLFT